MIGCYDFCGHYEWTFTWLETQGGAAFLERYWEEAISRDSQSHAWALILSEGIKGMQNYWNHTLDEEAAGYTITAGKSVFRIDMRECPSKGFLLKNDLHQHRDYCDHCIGWIRPMMHAAGFGVDHEHNHGGQCWWEFRALEDPTPPSSPGEPGPHDVRLSPAWQKQDIDVFARIRRANECKGS